VSERSLWPSLPLAGQVYPALPCRRFRQASDRARLDSRNQTRRLPDAGPQRRRPGTSFYTSRFRLDRTLSAYRVASLKFKATSLSMDGEMVCVDDNGLADFAKLHSRCFDDEAIFHAFDLMELAGEDLKPLPLIERQTRLRKLIHRPTGIHTSTMTPMAVPISSAPPASTVSKASSQSALEAATSPARSAASHGAKTKISWHQATGASVTGWKDNRNDLEALRFESAILWSVADG
jgi:hypothetical protein